jgi:hypothetical protein
MRAFVAAVVAASVAVAACGSAFAFDPATGQPWQRFSPPAAVAYFRLPFHTEPGADRVAYGLALTAPMLRSSGAAPLLIADTPRLLDLSFHGVVPDALRVTGQVAWATGSSKPSGDRRLNLLGGVGDLVLGLAGTAVAVYGIYSLVKKKCPAVSTSTGGCVKPAS